MDNLFLADVENSTVAEHPCGASALLDVVVAVKAEHALHGQFTKHSAHCSSLGHEVKDITVGAVPADLDLAHAVVF